MNLYPNLIIDALRTVRYPGAGKDIVTLGMLADDLRIDGRRVSFSIVFEKANDPFTKSVVKAAEAAILNCVGPDVEIRGNITPQARQAPRPEPEKWLPEVKNIVAVASGKGGVGKSTVAVNLAVALARRDFRVGLLDADIYGPSVPKMLGTEEARPYTEPIGGRDRIIPVEKYGVRHLSIGFFVDPEDALVWRGSMASNALKQLLADADWGALDYFLIDLPPGTSDLHLTLVQTVAVTGAVIVTTPQEVALADARKGVAMFTGEKINVPILGIVENMAWFTPAELPDNKYYIFGKDGGKRLAETLHTTLLGEIPLVCSICESGDAGRPVALDEDSTTGMAFRHAAQRLTESVDARNAHKPASQRVKMQHHK
jgi:ATP-binding protein involved in chromosome partitioning